MSKAAMKFHVPDHLHASSPVEHNGSSRNDVRMMVLDRLTGEYQHDRFPSISSYLRKGDVLVFNQSRTIPARLTAIYKQKEIEVRLARKIKETVWEVLIVGASLSRGDRVQFADGHEAQIEGNGSETPLVQLSFELKGMDFWEFIFKYGTPIYYEYIKEPWPLADYQTLYSCSPGSVEMTSAGRAFTWKQLAELEKRGVETAFLTLHTSLSYYSNNQWPNPSYHPESYVIPEKTKFLVQQAKREGRRIIAVGTTVVRALESAADVTGELKNLKDLSYLYVDEKHPLSIVDGLLTGFHEPEASHLDLLKAFIDEEQLMTAYQSAISEGYKWHEFGDVNLILER